MLLFERIRSIVLFVTRWLVRVIGYYISYRSDDGARQEREGGGVAVGVAVIEKSRTDGPDAAVSRVRTRHSDRSGAVDQCAGPRALPWGVQVAGRPSSTRPARPTAADVSSYASHGLTRHVNSPVNRPRSSAERDRPRHDVGRDTSSVAADSRPGLVRNTPSRSPPVPRERRRDGKRHDAHFRTNPEVFARVNPDTSEGVGRAGQGRGRPSAVTSIAVRRRPHGHVLFGVLPRGGRPPCRETPTSGRVPCATPSDPPSRRRDVNQYRPTGVLLLHEMPRRRGQQLLASRRRQLLLVLSRNDRVIVRVIMPSQW